MKSALYLCVLLNCMLSLPGVATSLQSQQQTDICYFGDSIMEGWMDAERYPELAYPAIIDSLFRSLGRNVTTVNLGAGGETTEDALRRIDAEVLARRPRIVVVSFGSNDWFVWGNPPFQRVPLPRSVDNLSLMFDKIHGAGAHAVLLGMPPVIEKRFYMLFEPALYAPYGGVEACNDLYNRMMRERARDRSVPVISIEWSVNRDTLLGFDGVHPSAAGHRRIAADLAPLLLALLDSASTPVSASTIDLYPVPFQPFQHTRFIISIGCRAATNISVRIFDIAGREIRKIVYFAWSDGTHLIPWDGSTESGTPAAQGAYTVFVQFGDKFSRHMLLIL